MRGDRIQDQLYSRRRTPHTVPSTSIPVNTDPSSLADCSRGLRTQRLHLMLAIDGMIDHSDHQFLALDQQVPSVSAAHVSTSMMGR